MPAAVAAPWQPVNWWLMACFAAVAAAAASPSASAYRILDRNGTQCVDADLTGALFALPYPCRGGRLCTARVALPPANGSRVAGWCGNRTAQLEVAWSEGRFRLELVFRQRTFQTVWAQVKKETVTYGYVSGLRLLADLRDPVFVNATIAKGESPPLLEFWRPERERTLLLFASPASSAFVCHSPEEVRLPQRQRDPSGVATVAAAAEAVVTFPAVRVELSFGVGAAGEATHDGAFLCEADSKRHRTGIAALVIAGVIGVCMLVIVIGYLVTRLNKNSHYSNME